MDELVAGFSGTTASGLLQCLWLEKLDCMPVADDAFLIVQVRLPCSGSDPVYSSDGQGAAALRP